RGQAGRAGPGRLAAALRGLTGRPVLCLHGFGMDRTVMAAALEPVLAHRPGWRRIYPDLPGHGESPAGPGDSDGVAASVHEWAHLLLGRTGPGPDNGVLTWRRVW